MSATSRRWGTRSISAGAGSVSRETKDRGTDPFCVPGGRGEGSGRVVTAPVKAPRGALSPESQTATAGSSDAASTGGDTGLRRSGYPHPSWSAEADHPRVFLPRRPAKKQNVDGRPPPTMTPRVTGVASPSYSASPSANGISLSDFLSRGGSKFVPRGMLSTGQRPSGGRRGVPPPVPPGFGFGSVMVPPRERYGSIRIRPHRTAMPSPRPCSGVQGNRSGVRACGSGPRLKAGVTAGRGTEHSPHVPQESQGTRTSPLTERSRIRRGRSLLSSK